MRLHLGLDGGGTGCRAVVASPSGTVLARATGGPANIASDLIGALHNIRATALEAVVAANGRPQDVVSAVLGLAGANAPGTAEQVIAGLPFAAVSVLTDAMTATKGALGDADGIVVALGTGSVLAVQRAGEIRQYGGRGFLLGDEGSGAVLGRSLLAQALRADDGFAPMTPLLRDVLNDMGGAEGVIGFGMTARPADFARLAPRITLSDDPAAVVIMAAAVADIGGMIDRLQSTGAMPVVFIGGLGDTYAARLAGRWDIRPPMGNGLDGALRLALRLGE